MRLLRGSGEGARSGLAAHGASGAGPGPQPSPGAPGLLAAAPLPPPVRRRSGSGRAERSFFGHGLEEAAEEEGVQGCEAEGRGAEPPRGRAGCPGGSVSRGCAWGRSGAAGSVLRRGLSVPAGQRVHVLHHVEAHGQRGDDQGAAGPQRTRL